MRQVFEESTKKVLKELSDFIQEYTNFGLEIWVDRLSNYTNETLDLPVNLMFRQVLEMSDAISELVSVGCINASKPLVRSLLDCYLQLAYLLKDDEKVKALFFLYHYNFKKYNKLDKMVNPEKNDSLSKRLKDDKNLKDFELGTDELELAKADIVKLKNTLESEQNKTTAEKYGNKQLRAWYERLVGNSIDKLANDLQEPGLYELLYRDLSEFSHGTDIVHNNMRLISDDHWGLLALRDISDVKNVVDTTILLLEKSILCFLKSKISELDKFKIKGFELADRAKRLREHNFTFNEQSSHRTIE